jgi:2-keto-3-deoxy-L-rhamnonate aldolase RhmA
VALSSPASQNRFLEKLKKRELSLGSWLSLYHPALPEIYCKAGLDWVTIDLEHSVISLAQAEELIRIVDLHDCTPLVRLRDYRSKY